MYDFFNKKVYFLYEKSNYITNYYFVLSLIIFDEKVFQLL